MQRRSVEGEGGITGAVRGGTRQSGGILTKGVYGHAETSGYSSWQTFRRHSADPKSGVHLAQAGFWDHTGLARRPFGPAALGQRKRWPRSLCDPTPPKATSSGGAFDPIPVADPSTSRDPVIPTAAPLDLAINPSILEATRNAIAHLA